MEMKVVGGPEQADSGHTPRSDDTVIDMNSNGHSGDGGTSGAEAVDESGPAPVLVWKDLTVTTAKHKVFPPFQLIAIGLVIHSLESIVKWHFGHDSRRVLGHYGSVWVWQKYTVECTGLSLGQECEGVTLLLRSFLPSHC
jgi:hypothetical protein